MSNHNTFAENNWAGKLGYFWYTAWVHTYDILFNCIHIST